MKTSNIVPKLRFPEFSGEWEIKELGEIADRVYQKNSNYKVEKVLTNSALEGVVEQSSFFEGKITTKGNLDNYFVLDVGDFVYNPRISKLAPVGPISRNNIEKGIVSPLYFVFRFKNSYTDYYDYYFRTLLWHAYIKDNANKGARFDRISISAEKFMGLPIPYPSQQEQQKIADCLASFDELLDLEEKKLSALQKYKKGLLQKLFPQGESRIPEWRFPEFQNSGEWKEKKLGELSKISTGKRDVEDKNDTGLYPFFVRSKKIEKIDSYSFDGEAILIPGDGKIGEIFHYIIGKFDFHQRVYKISNFNNVLGKYVFYCLENGFKKHALSNTAKATVDSLRLPMITGYIIKTPTLEEQQKIADFLSGVDELIEKQQQKIEQLKQHKKGLLQGLFPNINGVGNE